MNAKRLGERLARTRESLALTTTDVSMQLKLDVDKIEALEQGDFTSHAAPVFVAGYLRSYAKLLDLPGEEIVSEFESILQEAGQLDQPGMTPAVGNYGKIGNRLPDHLTLSDGVGWKGISFLVAVLIGLAIGGYLYWSGGQQQENTVADSRLKPAQPARQSNEPDDSVFEVPALQEPPVAEDAPVENDTPLASEADGPVVTMTEETPVPLEEAAAGLEPDAGSSTAVEAEVPVTIPEPEIIEEQVDVQPFDVASGRIAKLSLVFNEDSWVEVNDASGQQALYELARAGMVKHVNGFAPFRVHLGYVPGVDVSLNGEPYDLSRFSGRRSVRFIVGTESDFEQAERTPGPAGPGNVPAGGTAGAAEQQESIETGVGSDAVLPGQAETVVEPASGEDFFNSRGFSDIQDQGAAGQDIQPDSPDSQNPGIEDINQN